MDSVKGENDRPMGELRDIPVAMTAGEVLGGRRGKPKPPHVVRAAEEAIAQARGLLQARAVYACLEVLAVDDEGARVRGPAGEAILRVGPHVGALAPARQAVAAVGTIGPELDERVEELSRSERKLDALLLDSAGVVAVGSIGEAFRRMVEEMAAARDWGVSPCLAPGSLVGWPVREQRTVCGLLPLEQIGVRVNSDGVLYPLKSASWLIGIGPGYASHSVGSMCHLCSLSKTCWRRVEENA